VAVEKLLSREERVFSSRLASVKPVCQAGKVRRSLLAMFGRMSAPVLFVLALGGIVVFALIVNRLTGTKTQYLDALVLASDERELWRSAGADAFVLAGPQPLVRSFTRLGRHELVLTTKRLLWGQPALFGERVILQYAVLLTRDGNGAAGLDRLDGGFWGGGVITTLADPGALARAPGDGPEALELTPLPTGSSSTVLAYRFFVKDPAAMLAAMAQVPRP
jgi:hypothetical protein